MGCIDGHGGWWVCRSVVVVSDDMASNTVTYKKTLTLLVKLGYGYVYKLCSEYFTVL